MKIEILKLTARVTCACGRDEIEVELEQDLDPVDLTPETLTDDLEFACDREAGWQGGKCQACAAEDHRADQGDRARKEAAHG